MTGRGGGVALAADPYINELLEGGADKLLLVVLLELVVLLVVELLALSFILTACKSLADADGLTSDLFSPDSNLKSI